MNDSPLILEGITLMSLGMGFVFSFLVLMVGATRLLSAIAMRLQPAVPRASPTSPVIETSDDAVVAAISAALHHHKQKLNKRRLGHQA